MNDYLLPKILIVEDSQRTQQLYREQLGGRYDLIQACDMENAERLFRQHPDLAAIVMDACVPGKLLNTPPLVTRMRKKFKGPIIAASNHEIYQQALLQAGCNHRAMKRDVPSKLAEVIPRKRNRPEGPRRDEGSLRRRTESRDGGLKDGAGLLLKSND